MHQIHDIRDTSDGQHISFTTLEPRAIDKTSDSPHSWWTTNQMHYMRGGTTHQMHDMQGGTTNQIYDTREARGIEGNRETPHWIHDIKEQKQVNSSLVSCHTGYRQGTGILGSRKFTGDKLATTICIQTTGRFTACEIQTKNNTLNLLHTGYKQS